MIDSKLGFGVTAGLGIGIFVGFFLRRSIVRGLMRNQPGGRRAAESSAESFEASDSDAECKLVLVVRNDLKMGKGKAAAQCSHASVIAYRQAEKKEPSLLKLWLLTGQRKVVVKTEDEPSIRQLQKSASSLGLLTCVVRDAGHTQIPSGSLTVLGVGPGPTDLIDKATGHLKLF